MQLTTMKFLKKCAGEEILEEEWNLEKEELREVGGMEQNDHLTQGFEKEVESRDRSWKSWRGRHWLARKATIKKHMEKKDRKVKVMRREKAKKKQWGACFREGLLIS